jgi:hypothetical protein
MTPAAQLEKFLDRYQGAIATQARAARKKLRKLLPDALELVYDNYNALVILFAGGERTADRVVSLALYPRWVTLFFWNGAKLKDPKKLLQGSGATVRGIRDADLDDPDVIALVEQAASKVRFDKRGLIIQAVVKKQRPRR